MSFSRLFTAALVTTFIVGVFFVIAPAQAADTTRPTVSMISPEEFATVHGTVTLNFAVADDSLVRTFIVSTFQSNPFMSITIGQLSNISSGSYSFTWDTTTVNDAYYSLIVTAVDQFNNSTNLNYHVVVDNHGTFAQPALAATFLNLDDMATVRGLVQIQARVTDNLPLQYITADLFDATGKRIVDFQQTNIVTTSDYDKTYTWQLYADFFTPGTYHFQVTASNGEFFRTTDRAFVVAKPISTEAKYIANTVVKPQATQGRTNSGRILIQAENQKRLWYVVPTLQKRVFIGETTVDVGALRKVATTVSASVLNSIPPDGSRAKGNQANRRKYAGYVLQVKNDNRVWYIDPKTTLRFLVSDPANNRATFLRLGAKVTNAVLTSVPLKDGVTQGKRVVKTSLGTFSVTYLSFDRRNPGLRIMTDSANTKPCLTNCPTISLAEFARRRGAFAAINGSYFCPTGYSQCKGKTNSFDFQFFNSFTQTSFNRDRANLGYSSSYAAFDTTNLGVMDYSNGIDQASPMTQHGHELLAKGGTAKVRAIIYNQPRLVAQRKNVAPFALLEPKDTIRTTRSVLGWKGNTIYLMVISGATTNQAGAVAVAMGLDEALNLDGGGSTALYTDGKYIAGPGRNIPNAVLILPQ